MVATPTPLVLFNCIFLLFVTLSNIKLLVPLDKILILLLTVNAPETFNDDNCVDAPWNVVVPDTFNDETNVDALLKFGNDGGFVIGL